MFNTKALKVRHTITINVESYTQQELLPKPHSS